MKDELNSIKAPTQNNSDNEKDYGIFLICAWLLLIILFLMDPRPYNYEFRRPRPNNPTYQSFNAYDSLYHMGKKQYFNTNNILRDDYSHRYNLYAPNLLNPYQRTYRPQEANSGRTERQSVRYDEIGVNTDNKPSRANSNYSQRSKSSASSNLNSQQQGRASVLSTYGSNSLEKKEIIPVTTRKEETNVVFTRNSTSDIFKKQQRPFNIINMYSRHAEPLRKYPKLTQEHLLYEQGMNLIDAQ